MWHLFHPNFARHQAALCGLKLKTLSSMQRVTFRSSASWSRLGLVTIRQFGTSCSTRLQLWMIFFAVYPATLSHLTASNISTMGHSTSKLDCICGQDAKHQFEIELLNGRIKHLEAELSLKTPDVDANENTRTEHQQQGEEVSKAEDTCQPNSSITRPLNPTKIGKSLQVSL